MIEKKKGFVALLRENISIDQKLIKIHRIIHQDALCASITEF